MHHKKLLAGWQSGYAAACKAVYSGSIPDSASIFDMKKNKALFLDRDGVINHNSINQNILKNG